MTRLLACHQEATLQMVRVIGQTLNRSEPLNTIHSAVLPRQLSRTSATYKKTFYDVLDVAEDASQADIKKAYYDLSLKYHPDRNKNKQCGISKFREITEAYEILGNEKTREAYDKGEPLLCIFFSDQIK